MKAVSDRAELEELALSAHLSLARYEQAEAHAHRSLALLHPEMRRDRAIVTVRLAHAQLGQGEAESAVSTAMSLSGELTSHHPRVRRLLQEFDGMIRSEAASSPAARLWSEYFHDTAQRE